MTIIKTFTDGPDSFAVKTADSYELDFLGGDDALRILTGTTTAHLGSGIDRVRLDGGAATIFGEAGADRFDVVGGTATIDGGADNDRFNVSGGADHQLNGGAGDDLFVSYRAANGSSLFGGDGNDRFYGFGSGVTLAGGTGNDLYRILSSAAPVIVENAGEGGDTVQVACGISYTLGANLENLVVLDSLGSGEDAVLTGNELRNRITGSSARDTIDGMAGNDALGGGPGRDTISGGDGNDRITGGAGGDELTGGWGADVFVYTSVQDSYGISSGNVSDVTNVDEIIDFDINRDLIDLSAIDADTTTPGKQDFIWGGEGVGHLQTGTFAGTDLVADTDGDGLADFYIYFPGLSEIAQLTAANFIL